MVIKYNNEYYYVAGIDRKQEGEFLAIYQIDFTLISIRKDEAEIIDNFIPEHWIIKKVNNFEATSFPEYFEKDFFWKLYENYKRETEIITSECYKLLDRFIVDAFESKEKLIERISSKLNPYLVKNGFEYPGEDFLEKFYQRLKLDDIVSMKEGEYDKTFDKYFRR